MILYISYVAQDNSTQCRPGKLKGWTPMLRCFITVSKLCGKLEGFFFLANNFVSKTKMNLFI